MSDPEVCSIPDPSSCIVLPWNEDCAWFASNLSLIDGGGDFEACSRHILGTRPLLLPRLRPFFAHCSLCRFGVRPASAAPHSS